MINISISTSYQLVWQFKDKPYIKVSRCKKVINTRTNKTLKRTLNGSSIGYWITSKEFILEKDINLLVEKIPQKTICPF